MKAFLLFVTLITIYCEAYNDSKVSKNNPSCIRECQENRVYLNPQNIMISDEGIFLIDDANQKIPLLLLCSDIQGIYTLYETIGSDLAVAAYPVWCRTCMAWRVIGPGGVCSKCGNIP
ncbi:MAG: hypothetical protein K1X28_02870 [Parachlamydiales bacterium]|nr:hypothetical protein [Parachlamydiales bacterium]